MLRRGGRLRLETDHRDHTPCLDPVRCCLLGVQLPKPSYRGTRPTAVAELSTAHKPDVKPVLDSLTSKTLKLDPLSLHELEK